jgi:hypothetical protein
MLLVGKPEGTGTLGRPRHRCEENIKMDLQEVGWGTWTRLIRLRARCCKCSKEQPVSII